MSAASAQRSWEAENDVVKIDPTQNKLYALPDPDEYRELINETKPWQGNPSYFTHVRISALALLKMTTHARSGGSIEIMGLMVGYVSGTSMIITDAFRLPVEGTETRVNAGAEADEYMVNFGITAREGGGQLENPIGWYHSHPGYGCWLSGIDVRTQMQYQMVNDPFVAVVIDPDRTVSAGKVEIGAFRTYKEDQRPTNNTAGIDSDGFQVIPTGKIEDFGAHANSYYALEVKHFKSTLDATLLDLLWNKYWTSTLSQAPLFTNREYNEKQIADHAVKVSDATRKLKQPNPISRRTAELIPETEAGGKDRNIRVAGDKNIDQIVKGGDKISSEAFAGLLADDVKKELFWGVVDETKLRLASAKATAAVAGVST